MLLTALSKTDSSSSLFLIALKILDSLYLTFPGISKSNPAFNPKIRSFVAPQSDITTPSNLNSPLKIVFKRYSFSLTWMLLTMLYEHIINFKSVFLIIISKGLRYISLKALKETTLFELYR